MNESYFNGLDVRLVSDPGCLRRLELCPKRRLLPGREISVFSGPSLFARIIYPRTPLPTADPQTPDVVDGSDQLEAGLKLARQTVDSFRTSKVGGCWGCPVRALDSKTDQISTCGGLVKLAVEIIDKTQTEMGGEQIVCVTVRLAGPITEIKLKDKDRIRLLSKARCANLVQFSPLTSGNGSLTMPLYGQSLKNK